MEQETEINNLLEELDNKGIDARYHGMTFSQGIEEALKWVLERLDEDTTEDEEYMELVFKEK